MNYHIATQKDIDDLAILISRTEREEFHSAFTHREITDLQKMGKWNAWSPSKYKMFRILQRRMFLVEV